MKMKAIRLVVATAIGVWFAIDAPAAENPALMQPVKSVYAHYLKIQTELAKDSIKSVDEEAGAIAKAIEGDAMKMLPAETARQAKALAETKDLKAARTAFKPLSDSLIKYLADHNVAKGTYVEVYCPMAKAGWLQADKSVKNPYMGKAMLTCGVVKE
jgi:Protein of unknown function (DUF3347)